MVINETLPIRATIVLGIPIIVGVSIAQGVAVLPESISSHTSGSNGGELPRPLQRAVVAKGTVYCIC